MDALLALDSLTAPISSKSPSVHGYSQSSLSDTSLSPPPSFSRLPPDGHEFPPNYQEPNHFSVGVPALIEMEVPLDKPVPLCSENDPKMPSDLPPPPLPCSGPPTRKPSIGQEVELIVSPNRKLSSSSISSTSEEVAIRSPVRNLTWRKDEKSERSVRDKIAMFSNAQDGQTSVLPPLRRLSKYSSSEDVFYQDDSMDSASVTLPPGKMLSRSVLSVDKIGQRSPFSGHNQSDLSPNFTASPSNLYKKTSPVYNSSSDVSSIASVTSVETANPPKSLDYTTRTQSYMDLPSSSSSAYSSGSPDSSLSSAASVYTLGYSSTLPRKLNHNRHSTAAPSTEVSQKSNAAPSLYRRTSFCGATGTSNLHSRSQSLVDVGAIPSSKRNSIAGYKATAEDMRKASLNALIEQRRRGISKLRGLIIPEKVSEMATTNQAIIDLPEIKSRDSILSSKPQLLSRDDSKLPFTRHSGSTTNKWGTATCSPLDKTSSGVNASSTTVATSNLTSLPWKSQTPVANMPKYSPAFKRKSLTVYGVSSSASSVSSSLSSSREELRPLFENSTNNVPKSCPPPLPPMKPPRNATNVGSSITKSTLSPSYSSALLSHPEPPKSLESITSPTRSDLSFEFLSSNSSSPDLRMTTLLRSKDEMVQTSTIKGNIGKISNGELYGKNSKSNGTHSEKNILPSDVGRSTAEDDSDNDSAVSSSRSSISHGFSPPPSPLPDNAPHQSIGDNSSRQHLETITGNDPDKRPLRRTLSSETTASAASSTASTLTSGSQASCSSNGSSGSDSNKRVLKAQSVEAINRKNVLSSARYSSGRDLKVGSPLIQRKFDDDSEDFISSKDNNASDDSQQLLSRKTENYSGIVEVKHKVIQSDGDSKVVEKTRETVQYRMPLSEPAPDETVKMAYLEVEENEFIERPIACLSGQLSSDFDNAEGSEDNRGHEDIDGISSPARTTAPQPAPRRIMTPTLAGKMSQSNENITENKQKVPEKYSGLAGVMPGSTVDKAEDAEVYRYEKKVLSKRDVESNSSIPFGTDSQNGNITAEKNVESYGASDTWKVKSSNASSPTDTRSRAPVVPPKPKPVQRRSSLKGVGPPGETPVDPESNTSDNLIDILTGRSGKQDHTMTRLRERQKSRDLEDVNKSDLLPDGKELETEQSLHSGSRKPLISTGEQSSTSSNRVPSQSSRNLNCRRSVSVNDIKKAFEKAELALANSGRASNNSSVKTSANGLPNNHIRVSSLDSTTSEESMVPPLARYGSASNLHREQYGSITSLASSSTSLISQQELQTLIDEANQSIEESGGFCTPVQEVLVVILHRETMGGSVGITLAGGADYETKEITVHKVLAGSLADRDGRIQKGDRILSINGRSMKNVTHKESLEILKAPRHEVVLVVSRPRSDSGNSAPEEVHTSTMRASLSGSSRPPRILEQLAEAVTEPSPDSQDNIVRGPPVTIVLKKDGAGLGFSLEGGKDSPTGDKPLTIKKIFTGGAAEKHGQLSAGDELLVMNGKDLTVMSRIEAWSLMKRLPDGNVTLTVRCKVNKKQC
ncbi:uncharacterized protein bbg isoform X2 [Anabrus simplex]|uniref:uncharacterized protein bbg isoform X2 n=1 Tax=Anabrus simplex TaxID=316456 RepID=UPI0034DCD365